jgi:hypothetical protein
MGINYLAERDLTEPVIRRAFYIKYPHPMDYKCQTEEQCKAYRRKFLVAENMEEYLRLNGGRVQNKDFMAEFVVVFDREQTKLVPPKPKIKMIYWEDLFDRIGENEKCKFLESLGCDEDEEGGTK